MDGQLPDDGDFMEHDDDCHYEGESLSCEVEIGVFLNFDFGFLLPFLTEVVLGFVVEGAAGAFELVDGLFEGLHDVRVVDQVHQGLGVVGIKVVGVGVGFD